MLGDGVLPCPARFPPLVSFGGKKVLSPTCVDLCAMVPWFGWGHLRPLGLAGCTPGFRPLGWTIWVVYPAGSSFRGLGPSKEPGDIGTSHGERLRNPSRDNGKWTPGDGWFPCGAQFNTKQGVIWKGTDPNLSLSPFGTQMPGSWCSRVGCPSAPAAAA